MRMTLKRLTAWMLTLMMVIGCVPAYAADGNVVDYSDSTSAFDIMPLDDSASERVTVTFVINNSNYTNDPGSQTTHITAKAPIEGGELTYTKWAGRYKVTGTGTVCSYSIPAGTSLSDTECALPALTVENIGNTNTYSYSSVQTWITADGMVCSSDTVFTEDTTLYLQLYVTGSTIYSLDFVCSEENHSIKSVGSFLLGQSISQAHIDAATEAANAFESQWCSYGPASNQRLQKWQLKKTATGEMVDLSAGMAITEEYVNSQYGTAVKVYAVWEENTSTPVTATFQYDVTVDGTTTTQTADTRTLNAGDALGELPDMTAHTPEGSTFIGWQYTAEDGSLQYATAETVITADTVFTAVFGMQVTATFQYISSYDEETGEPVYETIAVRTLNAGDALGELPDMTAYNTLFETFAGWQYGTDAEGNPQYATAETVITADTVFTAVFTEVECGEIFFYDVLPNGSTSEEPTLSLLMPIGMTLEEVLEYSEEWIDDEKLLSECVWRTAVNGELADLTAVVTAGSEIHLYTHTYQIVLKLNLNTVSPAAFTSRTRASVDPSTAEDGTVTMTITAREGEKLTENDFIVNGTDLTQYAWTDGSGNAINLRSLIDEGVTGSITATSDGTLAEEEFEVSFKLESADENVIYTATVPAGTNLYSWIAANGETKTSHIIAGNAVKLGAFVWQNSDGTEITDGQTVDADVTVVGTLSDVTVTFYNDSNLDEPVGEAVTLSYGGTVSIFPSVEQLKAPEGMSFVEWRYKGTEGEVRFDSSTPVYENMQVYAYYTNMHTLTFYTDSAMTDVAGTVQVAHGGLFDTDQYPTVTPPAEQTLRYWVYVVDGAVQVFNPLLPVTADMSLYPVFDKYVFVLKDADTGKTITSIYAGDPVNFAVDAPEGYYYVGVRLDDGTTTIVTNGEQIASTDLFKVENAVNGQYTVHVTPVFEKQLTVVYHAGEGATILAANGADTYTQTVDASVQMPGALDIVRTDSSSAVALSGWATTADATTALYLASDVVTNEQLKDLEDENGEIHLYPVWTPAEDAVAVTFVSNYPEDAVDANGNKLEDVSYTIYIKSGAKPVMPTLAQAGMVTPSNTFEKTIANTDGTNTTKNVEKYTLSGWSVEEDGTGDKTGTQNGVYVVESQYQVAVNNPITFHAIWIDDSIEEAATGAYFFIRADGRIPQEPGGYEPGGYYPKGDYYWNLTGTIKSTINIVNDPSKVEKNIHTAPSVSKIITQIENCLNGTDGDWTDSSDGDGTLVYRGETLTADNYGTVWTIEWYACKIASDDGKQWNVDGRVRLLAEYELTYWPNGGTSQYIPPSETHAAGANVTIKYTVTLADGSTNCPQRDGYTFVGWSTDKNTTWQEVEAAKEEDTEDGIWNNNSKETLTMPAEDVDLYAIWKPDTIELSFNGVKNMLENNVESPASQEFSFLVEKQNADGTYTTVSTLKNDAQGAFSFNYEFDASGLHTFRVTEVKGNDTMIAYDGAVYTITVYIGDGDQGLYEVGRTVMKNNVIQSDTTVKFVNRVGTRDVTVTKVWNDNNDQDGIRPSSITVGLTQDGNPYGSVETLTAANGWSATWTGLPIATDGTQHVYNVIETAAGVGYTSETTGIMDSGFTITNTHVPMTTDITVTKQWIDNSDAAKVRPSEIVLTLTGSDGSARTATLTGAGNDWTHTFTDLPVYAGGVPVTYTLDEANVPDGYTKSVNGYTVTNTLQSYRFIVNKLVEGNFASPTKEFSFTANILGSDKQTVIRTETFTLAHNGSEIIENIPHGAYVQVTENPDGYEAKHQFGLEVGNRASYTAEQPITNDDQGVTFINTKNVTVDTGINLDGLPYMLLLLGAAGIAIVWVLLLGGTKKDD